MALVQEAAQNYSNHPPWRQTHQQTTMMSTPQAWSRTSHNFPEAHCLECIETPLLVKWFFFEQVGYLDARPTPGITTSFIDQKLQTTFIVKSNTHDKQANTQTSVLHPFHSE
jgi:hypothetical protein